MGLGNITAQYFTYGQKSAGTVYFWSKDRLNSIREMTDSSGQVQAEYSFDPFGRVTKVLENVVSDFQYDGYYIHSRSQLSLSRTRAYNSNLGRWINRDPIGELGSQNLYIFVSENPLNSRDPSGLDPILPTPFPLGSPYIPSCRFRLPQSVSLSARPASPHHSPTIPTILPKPGSPRLPKWCPIQIPTTIQVEPIDGQPDNFVDPNTGQYFFHLPTDPEGIIHPQDDPTKQFQQEVPPETVLPICAKCFLQW